VQATDGSLTAQASASFAITGSADTPSVTASAPTAQLVEASGADNAIPGVSASSITLTMTQGDAATGFDAAWLTSHGWTSSDAVQFDFYKASYTPHVANYIIRPDDLNSAHDVKSLFDKELGGTFFADGKWILSQKELVVYAELEKPVELRSVTFNCLPGGPDKFHLPAGIEIWGGPDKDHMKLLEKLKSRPRSNLKDLKTPGIEYKINKANSTACLKIIIKPAAGGIFIDEMFLN
jgi:hypothetical protein